MIFFFVADVRKLSSAQDAHTFSSQGEFHRVNLLATVLSFSERLVCDAGSVLSDITGGPDVNHKPKQ